MMKACCLQTMLVDYDVSSWLMMFHGWQRWSIVVKQDGICEHSVAKMMTVLANHGTGRACAVAAFVSRSFFHSD